MPAKKVAAQRNRKAPGPRRATSRPQKRRRLTTDQKPAQQTESISLQNDDKSVRSSQDDSKLMIQTLPMDSTGHSFSDRSAVLSAIRQVCAEHQLPAQNAGDAVALLLGEVKVVARHNEEGQAKQTSPDDTPATAPVGSVIAWPLERFASARREYGEDIVQFLRRVWKDAIAAGATRKDLREHDMSAEWAVSNYLRPTRDFPGGRKLPPDVALPTKKDLNDRALASVSIPTSDLSRLSAASWRRKRPDSPAP